MSDIIRDSETGEEYTVKTVFATSVGFGWDAETDRPWVERDGVRLDDESAYQEMIAMSEAMGPSIFEMAMRHARDRAGGDTAV